MSTFKLMTHENQYGLGISLAKYDAGGTLEAAFVLRTFEHEHQRLKYLSELAVVTGFEIEML
jgi:hypothetical protein